MAGSSSPSSSLHLPDVLYAKDRSRLLLIQHDLSQTPYPLLRQLLDASTGTLIVLRVLHPLSRFVNSGKSDHRDGSLVDLDWTMNIPGFGGEWPNPADALQSAIETAPVGSVTVLIDSLDTLASDLGSLSSSAHLVQRILTSLHTRAASSRLMLPLLSPSAIASHLGSFQPRTELALHAPQLLRTLAKDYSTASSNPRIWSLLGQLSGRREGERLVDGVLNGADGEVVVEVVKPERRGVVRVLEVWRPDGEVMPIDSLKLGGTGPGYVPAQTQPEAGLSFNLALTPDQQEARARVALPYAHTGQQQSAEIVYDPDSADDFDDEDPDDDLDI